MDSTRRSRINHGLLRNDEQWRGSGWRHVDLDSERGRLVRELAEIDLRLAGDAEQETDRKRREELLMALAPAAEPESKRPITWLDEEEEDGMAGLTDEQKRQKVVDFVAANKGVPRRSVLGHLGKGANYRKHKELLAQMVEEGVIECHQSDGVMRMWVPGDVVSSVAPEQEHAEVRQAVVTQTATSTAVELVDDDIAVMLVREREATKRAEQEREELQHERDQLAKTVERFELNAATIIAELKAERDQLEAKLDKRNELLNEQIRRADASASDAFDAMQERDQLKAEREDLDDELAAVKAERDQLKTELAETYKDLDCNAAIRDERDELKAELEVRIEERDELKAKLDAVKAERDSLKGFDALSDHYHEEMTAVEAELRCAQSEIFDLKGEIEDLEAERSELLQRLSKRTREEQCFELAKQAIDRAAADFISGLSVWREQHKRWIAL